MELPDPAAYVRKLGDRQLRAYQKFYPESSRDLPAFQAFRQWLFDELPALPGA